MASAVPFTHVVLTRFSVRAFVDSPPPSADWLRYRTELFAAYCYASMAIQTSHDIRWLVFCDESTDAGCIDELEDLATAAAPGFEVALTTPDLPALLAPSALARPGDRVLVTTRIDSDDALSLDFVATVQRYAELFADSGHETMLLNFAHGYKLREEDRSLWTTWNPHSPQLTLFERLGTGRQPTTVLAGNHGYMQEDHPLHVDAGNASWLQVVHGGNVSNAVGTGDRWADYRRLHDVFGLEQRSGRRAVSAPQADDARGRMIFRQALEDALLGGTHGPGAVA